MTISFVFVGFQFICIAAIMLTGEIFPSDKIKMVLLVITAVPGFVAMYSFRFRSVSYTHLTLPTNREV